MVQSEEEETISVKMAALCKVRNHCYFTAAGFFKCNFKVEYLLNQCRILDRLIKDLFRDDINDYIF